MFLWSSSIFARLSTPLARLLKTDHGLDVVLFATGRGRLPDPRLFDFDPVVFAEIVDVEPELRPRRRSEMPSAGALADRANELERRLGVDLVAAIRTDRHVGIDFVSGADFHRSYYSLAVDFAQSLDIGLRLCGRFEHLIAKYRPEAVLAFPGSLPPACLVGVARGSGISIRWLIKSSMEGRHFWSANQYGHPLGLEEAYRKTFTALKAGQADGSSVTQESKPELGTPERARRFLSGLRSNAGVRVFAAGAYGILRRDAARRLRRRPPVYGDYRTRDLLLQTFERWRWRRRMLRERPVMDEVPPDLPFVFFPLHIEPESTLMVEAQTCDNQLTIIDWLAKTAPPGWYVVVKEHPGATAPRPKGFWERIRAYPNVIVAATIEDAGRIRDRAKVVATINGSTGLQSAVAGNPVVTFSRDYIGLTMPHVLLAESYESTRKALRAIRDGELPAEDDRRLAGAAFVAALEMCSFSLGDDGLARGVPGTGGMVSEDVSRLIETLLPSLEEADPARADPGRALPSRRSSIDRARTPNT